MAALLRDAIPQAMRTRAQWLLWRFEPGEKKPKKMPYYAGGQRRTGEQGSERDRAALVAFDQVLERFTAGEWSGIGFAFLPGDGLIGIDIDGQIDADTGEISERAAAIIASCASYTEYSPSRRGVHIIVEGASETFKSNDIGLEVFCGRQFFTVTGQRYAGTPAEVAPIDARVLARLRKTVDVARAKPERPAPAATAGPVPGNDFAMINAAALANLSAWVPALFPQAKPAMGGYRVSSKSLGRELQEDLSLIPKGIKDWGEEQGLTPIDVVLRWGTSNQPADALKWLAGQLGITLDTRRRAKPSTPRTPLAPPPENPEPAQEEHGNAQRDAPHWADGLRRNGDGVVKNTPANADLILRHDERWKGVLAYDEFSYRIVKRRTPPFDGGRAGPWEETDAIKASIWLERAWAIGVKSEVIDKVVRSIAWDARYHSVREWLEEIAGHWDGTERLPMLMADVFGAEPSPYTEHVGIGLLVTAVARIYRPGCKVDTMVVLEGGQGLGKSTALIELFSPAWYVDIIDPPSHKDFYITLQGGWCVEIGEMQSFTRSEVNQVKQAITRRDDKFRAPYDKAASEHPRQSIFIGTTNADSYLMDPTGGRRFLPVRCTQANVEYIKAMREQLFAEAIRRYHEGFRWWEYPAEEAQAQQDQRYVEDSWTEPIIDWLNGEAGANRYPDDMPLKPKSVTTTQVMQHALQIEVSKHTRQDQMRVSQIMRRLGWEKAAQRAEPGSGGAVRIRPWLRPELPPAPAVIASAEEEPLPI